MILLCRIHGFYCDTDLIKTVTYLRFFFYFKRFVAYGLVSFGLIAGVESKDPHTGIKHSNGHHGSPHVDIRKRSRNSRVSFHQLQPTRGQAVTRIFHS